MMVSWVDVLDTCILKQKYVKNIRETMDRIIGHILRYGSLAKLKG